MSFKHSQIYYWHIRLWIRRIRKFTHCPFGKHTWYAYLAHSSKEKMEESRYRFCLSCEYEP